MVTTHNLGFPRVGLHRELKFAVEAFWRGEIDSGELQRQAAELRRQHWSLQAGLDQLPVGDFSLYDQVLDMSFTLGHVPPRVTERAAQRTAESGAEKDGSELDSYLRLARGRAPRDDAGDSVAAGEMTKWFDTNYHYIVPEFDRDTTFRLNGQRLSQQLAEARAGHAGARPVIIGPVTYLWLGKSKDDSDRLDHLPALLAVYRELLATLSTAGCDWVQVDEPVLVTELSGPWRQALRSAYENLAEGGLRLLLTSYFGPLRENLELACELPVQGIHLDAIEGREDVDRLAAQLPADRVLSLGVIDGRNIWKTDLEAALDWLEPLRDKVGERLWLAPSCSLLHVPMDLNMESDLDPELRRWLAFAVQKLEELTTLARALNHGREAVVSALADNAEAVRTRRDSTVVTNPAVRRAVAAIDPALGMRESPFASRAAAQQQVLNLPAFPTTTIGSFPQTGAIRKLRLQWRRGEIDDNSYREAIRAEIADCVRRQENLGLDVLVHGEAERNDMVEYFGEQLDGFAFTRFGWVQSYGSRCVKPPIIFGDVSRPAPMTVDWIRYAQSLTNKPVKGMLTGPVTILNWSFVRDDQPRRDTCMQLALAIREEVLDLERAGVSVIQIDEAALRERLPLRQSEWQDYLGWAVLAFRITANGVGDAVQIHTHMCYSEFNDIIESIAGMDADVITIETSRSDMELLDAFDRFEYPNSIGPGVYDIHSPNRPQVAHIVSLMEAAIRRIPAERLWVNPDCGLKTRQWDEVEPALASMVEAAGKLRSICSAGERHGGVAGA